MARHLSGRIWRHTVTLQSTPDVVGSQGGANPSPTGGPLPLKANVQLDEAMIADADGGAAGYTEPRTIRKAVVFLPSDPGCKRGDSFTWGAWTLNIKGPAQDTGYGLQFWVDCEAVT